MRCLERNKQTLYYALYTGKTAVTDSNGLRTGEYTATYGTPVLLKANISPASGTASVYAFGLDSKYSKIICVSGTDCPIVESSRIWIGVTPNADATNHNYVVERVAKSINSTLIALTEVIK